MNSVFINEPISSSTDINTTVGQVPGGHGASPNIHAIKRALLDKEWLRLAHKDAGAEEGTHTTEQRNDFQPRIGHTMHRTSPVRSGEDAQL